MVFSVANPLAYPVFAFSLWDLLKSIAVAWDFDWLLLSGRDLLENTEI